MLISLGLLVGEVSTVLIMLMNSLINLVVITGRNQFKRSLSSVHDGQSISIFGCVNTGAIHPQLYHTLVEYMK